MTTRTKLIITRYIFSILTLAVLVVVPMPPLVAFLYITVSVGVVVWLEYRIKKA